MFICNYCGRHLKQEYEKCPGCNGSSFTTKAYLGEEIIDKPPKDGYHLNLYNLNRIHGIAFFFTILNLIIITIPFFIIFLGYFNIFIIEAFFFVPIIELFATIFFYIANRERKKYKRIIQRTKKLAKYGMLVKGIPYKMYFAGQAFFKKEFKCIEVIFKNSNDVEIPLYSETKYNAEKMKHFETADLLIDPDDYSNYFIDYEIF